jgi:hypothetical protein
MSQRDLQRIELLAEVLAGRRTIASAGGDSSRKILASMQGERAHSTVRARISREPLESLLR